MRKIFSFFMVFSILCSLHSQVKKGLVIPEHPKIGLSLSGGGAKGFAHVGVLKILDSLGVKVDYISGTSMGAIVGGLYASGYTGKDIEKIILDTDFYTLIANEKSRQEASFFNKTNDKYLLNVPVVHGKFNVLPKAISTGQKNIYMLKELFNNVSSVSDFSKLPIPFMCVATNLESGTMKIFEKGDLVSSIMASSAFPSLMDPVKIGDSLYIDGAMTVNYPSEPLKEKGMDIVIGVDLSQPLSKRDELNSAIAILNQVIDFGIKKETKNQYQYTDINIHPDLQNLGATSYGDKQKILTLGYDEAQKYSDILSKLPKRENSLIRAPFNPIYSNIYKIDSIAVVNNKIFNKSYMLGKMNLKIPSMQTYGSINRMIDKLYATNNFRLINYDLVQHNGHNILKLQVSEEDTRFFLKFGLHYDENFKTGLLLNATAKRFLFRNSILSLDIVLGDTPRYYFNYFVDNGYIPGLGIYASGMNLNLNDSRGNQVEDWNWYRNEIYLQSTWKDRYAVGGGLSHDYYESKTGPSRYENSRNFFNPYIFIKSDTRDDKDFATRGLYLDAEGKLLDIFSTDQEDKIIQVKADIRMNFPFTGWFTYRLNLFGGFTLGDTVSEYYKFRPGGIFEQNLGNLIHFYGNQFGSVQSNNVVIAISDLQFRLKKNIFATAHISFMNTCEEPNLKDIFKIGESSAGATLGYKSPFGQIKLNYSQPFNNKKGIFSVILGHWF